MSRKHGEREGQGAHAENLTDEGAEKQPTTAEAVDGVESDDAAEPVGDSDEEGEGGGLGETGLLDDLGGN